MSSTQTENALEMTKRIDGVRGDDSESRLDTGTEAWLDAGTNVPRGLSRSHTTEYRRLLMATRMFCRPTPGGDDEEQDSVPRDPRRPHHPLPRSPHQGGTTFVTLFWFAGVLFAVVVQHRGLLFTRNGLTVLHHVCVLKDARRRNSVG